MISLVAALALAQVTFVANGAAAVVGATGTCTPTMPATILANDILLAVACGEGPDEGVSITLNTANGFAQIGTTQSGSNGGGTEANPDLDCAVFWKRAVGADAAPIFADSGDHTTCAVHQFRGAAVTGDPWDVFAEGNDGAANDTTGLVPGATTTEADTLVVLIQGTSNNATSTANCSAWTNANLGALTERFDSTNTIGLGGGHCMATGTYAGPGAYGDTTVTLGATTYKAAWSIALKPEPVTDQQSMMGFF